MVRLERVNGLTCNLIITDPTLDFIHAPAFQQNIEPTLKEKEKLIGKRYSASNIPRIVLRLSRAPLINYSPWIPKKYTHHILYPHSHLYSPMDPPHILITGGSGFLGTSIISALLSTKKYTITALDISLPPLGTQTFSSNPRMRYTRCDILDVPSLSKVFAEIRPTAVIHTAGLFHVGTRRYSMEDHDAVFKVNVEGTRNVLEASKEHGVKAFVYTSSITVLCDDLSRDFRNADETWPLGKTDTSYGQSKVCTF